MPRTFLPLHQRLPNSSSADLLGCIVSDIYNPFAHYTPEKPSAALDDIPVDTTIEKDIYTVIDRSYGLGLRASLQHLLSFDWTEDGKTTKIFQSTAVRTCRLRSHNKAFETLVKDPEVMRDLRGILKEGHGKAYMVVGIKTCYNGKFIDMIGQKFSVTAEAKLPVKEFAAALSTLGYLGHIADPKISVSKWNEMRFATAGTGEGEQVFAIEYRLIRKKRFVSSVSPGSTVEWEHGMFAGGEYNGDPDSKEPVEVTVGDDVIGMAEDSLDGLPAQYQLISSA